MEKMYLVILENIFDKDYEYTFKIKKCFKDIESAKKYANQIFQINLLSLDDEEIYDIETTDTSYSIFEKEYYDLNHINIYIREIEVSNISELYVIMQYSNIIDNEIITTSFDKEFAKKLLNDKKQHLLEEFNNLHLEEDNNMFSIFEEDNFTNGYIICQIEKIEVEICE